MEGVTVVQQLGDVEYGWKADDARGEPDSPEVLLVRRTAGGAWTVVERLPSRPTSIAQAEDGTLAMVLQSSEHLDELRIGEARVAAAELPELPVRDAIRWHDAAPNGAKRLLYSGTEVDGSIRTVFLVEHNDDWVLDPSGDDCRPVTPLPDEEGAKRVTWNSSEATVRVHQDLNGDGEKEYILYDPSSCGTGGCSTPILQGCGALTGGYRVIGDPEAWGDITVLETRTNGWRDIQFESRGGPEDSQNPVHTYTYPDPTYASENR